MKSILTLLFLHTFLLSSSQFAIINDNDSFVNVRESPEQNSKVIDKLPNGTFIYCFENTGNWTNIDYEKKGKDRPGYVYKTTYSLISRFPAFRVTKETASSITLRRDSIEIFITQSKFDKNKHKLTYFKEYPDQIRLIDNKQYWGTDGGLPTTQYAGVVVRYGTKNISLPKSALEGLYEPSLYTAVANYDSIHDVLYVQTMNSDGAGSYFVIWKIEKGVYSNRFIAYGF